MNEVKNLINTSMAKPLLNFNELAERLNTFDARFDVEYENLERIVMSVEDLALKMVGAVASAPERKKSLLEGYLKQYGKLLDQKQEYEKRLELLRDEYAACLQDMILISPELASLIKERVKERDKVMLENWGITV